MFRYDLSGRSLDWAPQSTGEADETERRLKLKLPRNESSPFIMRALSGFIIWRELYANCDVEDIDREECDQKDDQVDLIRRTRSAVTPVLLGICAGPSRFEFSVSAAQGPGRRGLHGGRGGADD